MSAKKKKRWRNLSVSFHPPKMWKESPKAFWTVGQEKAVIGARAHFTDLLICSHRGVCPLHQGFHAVVGVAMSFDKLFPLCSRLAASPLPEKPSPCTPLLALGHVTSFHTPQPPLEASPPHTWAVLHARDGCCWQSYPPLLEEGICSASTSPPLRRLQQNRQ